MKILVTGCAGFIGMHAAEKLALNGHQVIGIDSLNNYYDVNLKQDRLRKLSKYPNFNFIQLDLSDRKKTLDLFEIAQPEYVLHLAAQAGVRHSVKFPEDYISNNLVAFANILDGCRNIKVSHLVYASSSSVYGSNTKIPFEEGDICDTPNSLYAATKKSNELMAYSYSHLYNLPITGLRYFTVYGPWGRPDMAPFLFTKSILSGEPIKVFNNGDMIRDFTYISDIIDGTVEIISRPSISNIPNNIFKIGNNKPVALLSFIQTLENLWGKEVEKIFLPNQPGDLKETVASVDKINEYCAYMPKIGIEKGLKSFVDWYKEYYLRLDIGTK